MNYKRCITIFFRNFAAIMTQDKLWNSNYCKVMAANFALFFAFYVLTPLLPLYLSEQFGASKDVIGLVLSGYTITALLFRPFSVLPPLLSFLLAIWLPPPYYYLQ